MNNVQFKYLPLATVSITQLFYTNRICKDYKTGPVVDFKIVPTPECIELIKRMDLVFKEINSNAGFIILARVMGKNAGGNDIVRYPPRNGDALSFLILLNNADIMNFNDLPYKWGNEKIYLFSNNISEISAPRNNLHLTKDIAGVNAAHDLIKKSGSNYRYHHSTNVVAGGAVVKHLLTGNTVLPVSLVNDAGQCDLFFNLSSFKTGKCQLLINSLLVEEFYFTGINSSLPIFGVIELQLSDALEANYRIMEPLRSLSPQRPVYHINFINRKTIWRYTVRLQANSPLYLEMAALTPADKDNFINQLNVVSNDSGIVFSRLSSTDNEFVFISGSEIFLQEKYYSSTSATREVLSLTLKKYITDASREAVVKSNLPYPSTESIDASVSPNVYSDIFLTL